MTPPNPPGMPMGGNGFPPVKLGVVSPSTSPGFAPGPSLVGGGPPGAPPPLSPPGSPPQHLALNACEDAKLDPIDDTVSHCASAHIVGSEGTDGAPHAFPALKLSAAPVIITYYLHHFYLLSLFIINMTYLPLFL